LCNGSAGCGNGKSELRHLCVTHTTLCHTGLIASTRLLGVTADSLQAANIWHLHPSSTHNFTLPPALIIPLRDGQTSLLAPIWSGFDLAIE
jgi:hypothetical protein